MVSARDRGTERDKCAAYAIAAVAHGARHADPRQRRRQPRPRDARRSGSARQHWRRCGDRRRARPPSARPPVRLLARSLARSLGAVATTRALRHQTMAEGPSPLALCEQLQGVVGGDRRRSGRAVCSVLAAFRPRRHRTTESTVAAASRFSCLLAWTACVPEPTCCTPASPISIARRALRRRHLSIITQ